MNSIVKLSQIKCDSYQVIFQKGVVISERPAYRNRISKLLFFVFREGISQTIRKVSSKKIFRKYCLKKYLTALEVIYLNKKYYNFSIQYHENESDYIISNKFYLLGVAELKAILETNSNNYSFFNQFDEELIEGRQSAHQLPLSEIAGASLKKTDKGIVIIGLGDYSRTYIGPLLTKYPKIACIDYNANLSIYFKKKFHFKNSGLISQDAFTIIRDISMPLLIIASYHSDHSWIAEKAFEANSRTLIFIEKPPCVTLEDLKKLILLYKKKANIEIGFNRRFIPYNQKIKKIISEKKESKVINISVKEIPLEVDHWYFWNNQGSRITGNVVHWIDLAQYWIDSEPSTLSLLKSSTDNETFTLSIQYKEGSLVNILVSDNGNDLRGVQEKIEVRIKEETIFIDDYINMHHICKNGNKKRTLKLIRDKGHQSMYKHLLNIFSEEKKGLYTLTDLIRTTLITYYFSYMARNDIKVLNIEDELTFYNSIAHSE